MLEKLPRTMYLLPGVEALKVLMTPGDPVIRVKLVVLDGVQDRPMYGQEVNHVLKPKVIINRTIQRSTNNSLEMISFCLFLVRHFPSSWSSWRQISFGTGSTSLGVGNHLVWVMLKSPPPPEILNSFDGQAVFFVVVNKILLEQFNSWTSWAADQFLQKYSKN